MNCDHTSYPNGRGWHRDELRTTGDLATWFDSWRTNWGKHGDNFHPWWYGAGRGTQKFFIISSDRFITFQLSVRDNATNCETAILFPPSCLSHTLFLCLCRSLSFYLPPFLRLSPFSLSSEINRCISILCKYNHVNIKLQSHSMHIFFFYFSISTRTFTIITTFIFCHNFVRRFLSCSRK